MISDCLFEQNILPTYIMYIYIYYGSKSHFDIFTMPIKVEVSTCLHLPIQESEDRTNRSNRLNVMKTQCLYSFKHCGSMTSYRCGLIKASNRAVLRALTEEPSRRELGRGDEQAGSTPVGPNLLEHYPIARIKWLAWASA